MMKEIEKTYIKESFWKKIVRKTIITANRINGKFCTRIVVDMDSISNISDCGIYEIVKLFRQHGVFIYRSSDGNPPIVLSRGVFSRVVKIIDFDSLTEKEKEKLLNKIK